MGGPGSTRWGMTVTRLSVDGLPRLDVRVVAREEALRPGTTSTVTWGTGATITLSVPAHIDDIVYVAYEVQNHRDGVMAIRERVELTRTPCTFGGFRVWFACPSCGTTCAVLYALCGRFRCRKRHHLAHASA